MKVAYIEWLDSAGSSSNEWQSLDELNLDTVEVKSAGIVEFEDSETITLVCNKTEASYMGDITVPKFAITYRLDFDAQR